MSVFPLYKTIEGYLITRRADGISSNTIDLDKWALDLLARHLGDVPLEEIGLDDLREFMAYLREDYVPVRSGGDSSPLSGSSIDRVWVCLRSFFGYCVAEYGIERPDENLARPKFGSPDIHPFNQEEVKQLIKGVKFKAPSLSRKGNSYQAVRRNHKRDLAIVLTLLDTGLRVSELCRLEVKDVDPSSGEIRVRAFGTGLKTHARSVYAGRRCRKALWSYLAERESKPGDPFFLTSEWLPMNRRQVYRTLRRLGDKVGVDSVHPHRFRHTFAIQFLRNGRNVFALKRLLGHSSLKMTERYLAIARSDIEDAHRGASPVDNWRV